jgi:hypothetical protein
VKFVSLAARFGLVLGIVTDSRKVWNFFFFVFVYFRSVCIRPIC